MRDASVVRRSLNNPERNVALMAHGTRGIFRHIHGMLKGGEEMDLGDPGWAIERKSENFLQIAATNPSGSRGKRNMCFGAEGSSGTRNPSFFRVSRKRCNKI